ncbi:MAG: helix-turn-helix domain-containing protein [Rhodoglobus sp.]
MESIEDIIRKIAREEVRRVRPEEVASVKIVEASANQLFSVRAVARLLEVSADYVYDRIRSGELRTVELGGGKLKQRIHVEELQKFIRNRSGGSR